MDAETRWVRIENERRSLADLLEALTPSQWEAPSLCSEWRVRDVAAHVAMTPTEPSPAAIITGLVKARGDVWAVGRDVARAHAERPTDEIPTDAGVAGFERGWSMGWPFWAKRRTRGTRLVATDAPVDVGEGDVVEGSLADLLLLITGRSQAAARRLRGPGLARLG